jgi:VIT1/CCC1 family predicted Fe2+/Mn2+ transporter
LKQALLAGGASASVQVCAAGSGGITKGLVGVAPFAVLPDVSTATTLLVTLAAMLPCLAYVARNPKPVRVPPLVLS